VRPSSLNASFDAQNAWSLRGITAIDEQVGARHE
jgi:hypothetical protein